MALKLFQLDTCFILQLMFGLKVISCYLLFYENISSMGLYRIDFRDWFIYVDFYIKYYSDYYIDALWLKGQSKTKTLKYNIYCARELVLFSTKF